MTTKKKITITMSETAPVTIDPTVWDCVATADTFDGPLEVQANTEWGIRVRQHPDGRRLVYGWERAGNGGQYAGYRAKHAGYLVEAASVQGDGPSAGKTHPDEAATIRAIRRVAGVIGDEQLGAECVADLPAVEL